MHATTPTGWRFTTPPMRPPAASGVVGMTDGCERDRDVLERAAA